ncbi:GDYXXLXY domain-containing protein [Nitratireductor alexandrii]|uniref:GDYXXLXY domain-containing protein n=1 Tax=Nitratireductor alexandrii TaxID=2448161 RepID=UPI000FDB3C49|nr:GDYXXLXY domain-containing protein [Nitratireductor alexandrii]
MKARTGLFFAAALAAALLQIGFLAWMIQARADILRHGWEVRLKVEPVDPRDLLRGDYVRLGYGISVLPKTLFSTPPAGTLAEGAIVLVDVQADEKGLFQPVAMHLPQGAPPPDEKSVRLRGALRSGLSPATDRVRLRYGIERFYLPEGEGRAIEADMRKRSFYVIAAVSAAGQAQIKAFQDGDTTLYQEPLY